MAALLITLSLVAAIPELRWPVLRLTAAAATTLMAPVAPDADALGSLDRSTTFVDTKGEVLLRIDGGRRSDPVHLADLPDYLPRAVLAAEDRSFFEHPGVDPVAIGRATLAQLAGGNQGGSTITQQLAKINFTGSDNTLTRKASEVLYAADLEREFTKEELLARYLNQIYFGDGAYGIAEAAHTFFGVDAARLSLAQAATLAGKIRAPEALDPHDDPEGVRNRRNDVLEAMRDAGWIDEATFRAGADAPLDVRPQMPPPPSRAPWFVEFVKREARHIEALGPDPDTRLARLLNEGYTVETTLDLGLNDHTATTVQRFLDKPGYPTGAVVSVVPNDGAIRIMVGGVEYQRQQFNAATQARRQPGSTFKPLVYLAALAQGIDPRSRFEGHSPQRFEHEDQAFEVRNYGQKSYGKVTLDDALTKSINVVYMALGLEVGPEEIVRTAEHAGVDAELQPVPSVSLGGTNPGVSPLEMAEVYATLAAEGTHATPYAIRRIRNVNGDVVYEHRADTDETIKRDHILVMNRPLLETVRRGTGRAAALPGREVAGKTGTSSDFRDAWFVGYVPQFATAVWIGHLDNRSMTRSVGRVSGGSIPATIFHEVMAAALDGINPIAITTLDPDELNLELVKRKARARPTTSATTTSTSTPESTTTPVDPAATPPIDGVPPTGVEATTTTVQPGSKAEKDPPPQTTTSVPASTTTAATG